MKRKTFTFADLRKANEEAITKQLLNPKSEAGHHSHKDELPHLHRRRKVNSLCRCTPQNGIEVLEPQRAQQFYDERLSCLMKMENPHQIADRAIQAGKILRSCGRPRLALELMEKALKHLLSLDEDWQWHYDRYGQMPTEEAQWGMHWSWRTAAPDARSLAKEIDAQRNEVSRHLGWDEHSFLYRSVCQHYELLWRYIYDVSDAEMEDIFYPFRKPHDPLATFRRRR